ncbi:IS200/IS605 family transposase [Gloeocapsopsis dulcis]|uniref:IS200/IS605 family transposase n=1 Tax=Gloeocapsopsis dulcis AAB1 = 1H9 TaxID=1433147 RepID=A0A6N8FTW7_9CHRO|nr:IS200/IS605 family transposase [Gloeocapsopsis dulcis]MUL35755.1 IS200/IS605 family transposase [Gloeocapsopsis dulcis AAB1 = 1H9]WNN90960.1 IS200/IS605 family transposase [Gloeocapsopsis dulcis]
MAKLSVKDLEYRRESNSVSLVNFHFVFVPKRRKPILVGQVAERLQEIIFELVVEHQWKLIALEVMPDHVHLLVNVKPTDSAAQVARWVKGRAAHHLRKKEFPHLLRLPSLWTSSYFISSVGNASTETVRRYIESQTGK